MIWHWTSIETGTGPEQPQPVPHGPQPRRRLTDCANPGIGIRTTNRLLELRRQRRIRYEDLTRMRCVLAKAKPFIITCDYHPTQAESSSESLHMLLRDRPAPQQMGLWG